MAKAHRLGHLQMGKTGQDHVHVLLCHIHQRPLQVVQQGADQVNLATQPQAYIGGYLVVSAAARVQSLACIAHQGRQGGFDVEVHILQIQLPVKLA